MIFTAIALSLIPVNRSFAVIGGSAVPAPSLINAYTVAFLTSKGGICSAVLIGGNEFLTAAHCVVDDKAVVGKAIVAFGSRLFDPQDPTQRGASTQVRQVKTIFVHPGYRPGWTGNDLAMGKFKGDCPEGYLPARLPGHDFISEMGNAGMGTWLPEMAAWSAGYGRAHDNSIEDRGVLRTLKLSAPVLANELNSDLMLSNDEILFHTPKNAHICFGDSGGPVFMADSSGLLLLGINSRIMDTTGKGDPKNHPCEMTDAMVATLVPKALDWIQTAKAVMENMP
jgi:secreted trypsin-like serine protease